MRDIGPTKDVPRLARYFASNLRHRRELADLSQSQLAARTALSTGYISMLERGEKVPTLDTIERCAGALGVRDPRMMFRSTRG